MQLNALATSTEHAVERILSSYRLNRVRAALLRARLARGGGSIILQHPKGESTYEDGLAALADITSEIDDYKIILASLKRIEREFVRLRYLEGLPMKVVARALGRTERATYHIRRRVLAKGAAALGFAAKKFQVAAREG